MVRSEIREGGDGKGRDNETAHTQDKFRGGKLVGIVCERCLPGDNSDVGQNIKTMK